MDFLTEQRPASARYRPPSRYIENPDAIIIGSGLGGMALASTLAQKRGMKVLVLEGAPTPGGATHVHEMGGFEYPAGLHSVGDMDTVINPAAINAWQANYVTGNQVQWAKMPEDHEYAYIGDEGYPWYSTAEENIEYFSKQDFGGKCDFRAYFEMEKRVQASGIAWALTKLMPNAMPMFMREAFYKVAGRTWRQYMARDTHSVLRKDLGFTEKAAALFEYMYGNYGRTPDLAPFTMHASVMYHYRQGAYFPVGGPGSLALAIIPIVEAAGGQVATHSRVQTILIENGNKAVGVRLQNGEEIRSKLVISDASAWTTFMDLMPREVSDKHGYTKVLSQMGSSPSHITLMVGWKERIEFPRHIVWQMPQYPGELPLHDVSGGDRIYKEQMRFEGMPAYLMSPSSRDPMHDERYPGKSTMMLLVESNPAWLARCVKEPAFRTELEAKFKESAMRIVEARFPQCRGKTPAFSHVHFPMGCNPWAREGGSYGLEPSADRFVKHTHVLRPKTTIDNFFLVGQDAFMPGIAGVLIGARFAYTAITGDLFHLQNTERSSWVPQLPKPSAQPVEQDTRQVA